jgi:hypothetical protein
LDSSESGSEIPGKFCYVVLEKDEKVGWTDRFGNEEILQRAKKERIILPAIKRLTVFVISCVETAF